MGVAQAGQAIGEDNKGLRVGVQQLGNNRPPHVALGQHVPEHGVLIERFSLRVYERRNRCIKAFEVIVQSVAEQGIGEAADGC